MSEFRLLPPTLPAPRGGGSISARRWAGALAALVLGAGVLAAPPAQAAELTISTFPSTSQVQPLIANPSQDPGFIGQAIVVPEDAPVLTEFTLAFAADASPSITVQLAVLPFDPATQRNTGEPVFLSNALTVTNPSLASWTFATNELSLMPGRTYLIGLTTILQPQTTTNRGAFGTSPDSRYPQGTSWAIVGGHTDLAAGKSFSPASSGFGLTFSATFTSAQSADGPPEWLQQVGMPASGECTGIDDAALNRGGASAGGWGRSWAQWMNDGAGGAVCTRTLAYVGNGRWTVRA